MDTARQTRTTDDRLFELTLRPERGFWNDGLPDTSPDGRVGQYLASGQGTADGAQLEGTVSWDLFEDQEDETIHPSDMAGHIHTTDGASISFQTLGVFIPENDAKTRWQQSAAMRFHTDDERYGWLNGVLATMDGSFDYDTMTHRYHVSVKDQSR